MILPKIKYKKFVNLFNIVLSKYPIDEHLLIPSKFREVWEYTIREPFWNNKIRKISNLLFLPINGNLEKENKTESFNRNKWFHSEFYKEKYKGARINDIRTPVNNATGIVKKIVKIKLFCNPIQKATLKRFMGVYRYFYNRTINYSKNINKKKKESFYYVDNTKSDTKVKVKLPQDWYGWYSLKKLLYKNQPKWVKEINFNALSIKQSIREALIGIKTNLKKKQKFQMKLKTKKDLVQTFRIEKQSIRNNTIYCNYKIGDKFIFRNLKMSDKISNYNYCDSNLSYHRILDEFTLNLTYNEPIKENHNDKTTALDPGVKCFMTGFSEDSVFKLGVYCKDKIEKVCKEIDIIQSKIAGKINANQRRNLKKAFHRKIQYLKDLKNELHNQVIHFLVTNFGKIIITPFETQEMVQKLSSKVARLMNNLSYYKFRTKLESKCKEFNVTFIVKPEYYTSRTCTSCGNIDHTLGNKNIYHCRKCGMVMERDYNGARNIMLRNNF